MSSFEDPNSKAFVILCFLSSGKTGLQGRTGEKGIQGLIGNQGKF